MVIEGGEEAIHSSRGKSYENGQLKRKGNAGLWVMCINIWKLSQVLGVRRNRQTGTGGYLLFAISW
jgi:hypothetical protein